MEDKAKIELFENIPVPKAVLQLGIPTVLSSLVMVIYNLADTYFVGMLNDPVQNAAVTLAGTVLLAFMAVTNLFGVGSSSMMSRALGRREYDLVRATSAFGFYCTLLFALLYSFGYLLFREPILILLGTKPDTAPGTDQYLFWTTILGAVPAMLNIVLAYQIRSEGASLHASLGTMSGCALNMILDPIFILPWGLNMGAAGAGCATFISNCAACLYFFVLLFRKRGNTYVCIDPRKFRFRRDVMKGVFGVGIPAAIQNLLNVTGMTILNNFTASYGTGAVAAMGIAGKLHNIPTSVALGLSQGMMPLVSYNYASGNSERLKKALLFTMKLSLAFLLCITAGYFFFAGGLIKLFMPDAEVVAYGTRFLRALSLAMPFVGVDFTAVGVFQACGMGSRSLLFAILRKIVLEIPFLLLLDKLFPLYGLAWAQCCAEVVLAAAAIVILLRLFRRLAEKGAPEKEARMEE